VAESLARILEGLPGFGPFLGVWASVLIVVAAGFFSARNTRPVVALRNNVDRLLGGLVAAILLVMVGLSGLQILLRNLFESGLLWIDPLLRHLTLLLAFTGAVIATGAKRHVQINVLGRLLKGVARRIGGAIVAAASAVVCLALTHASLQFLFEEIEFGEAVFLGLPAWIVAAVFPFSFTLLAFRFFYLVFLELAGEAPPSGEEAGAHERLSREWGAG
jgi:TRAP-type C4-dicarboxylate transport system permease small subunit